MIRTEQVQDYVQVKQMLIKAFQSEAESRLVEHIRSSPDFIPQWSIVSETDGIITGHIMLSLGEVIDDNRSYRVACLAPLAVDPAYQRKGIGGELIREALRRCPQFDIPFVFLIGHPSYYPRFGFVTAAHYGFQLKQFEVPAEVFMVYEIEEGALNRLKGELRYSKAFLELE
ncbi:GNAT family N-acetyltransferase [Paenibacillus faecalis]|uniref:GNAT family N-acetyltransferase n=1 Tax=Paenibacillus faecalis TaxID=2079532 RepID=UPI000D1000CD|nr:N-acetyltransferase [Paenibacillus faecalis]